MINPVRNPIVLLSLLLFLVVKGGLSQISAERINPNEAIKTFDKVEFKINLHEEVEKRIQHFINRRFGKHINPYDPDHIDVYGIVTFEDGTIQQINAFYYEEFSRDTIGEFLNWDWSKIKSESGFRWRYTPKNKGEYKVEFFSLVKDGVLVSTGSQNFSVGESDNKGFIQVGANNRYFQLDNGETFFPVGGNLPPESVRDPRWDPKKVHVKTSQYAVDPHDPKGRLYHPLFYPYYQKKLEKYADNGANYVRMIAFPWTTDIEYESLNNYSNRMHIAWELDQIFEKCEELDLKVEYCIQVQYTLEDPGYYYHFNWDWPSDDQGCEPGNNKGYCYQESLGLEDPMEFFTDDRAKENWKKKLRYIIARWGYSTGIGVIQLMSEVNGTGVVPNFERVDHFNDKGEKDYDYCRVVPGQDVISKPYYDKEGYAEAVYNWHEEMASYIKNDLGHTNHLIGPSYAGQPRADMGDLTFRSKNLDFNSFNVYSPDCRVFFIWEQRAQNSNKGKTDSYCGQHGNTVPGESNKPMLFSEIGTANFYRCDQDVGDIKMMLISPFTGIAGMALNWDNSTVERADNWYLYGRVSEFFEGVDLNSVKWYTQSDETSWDEIEYMGELMCLQSQEKHKRAMGAVHNRTWNYHTKGEMPGVGEPCGDPAVLGVGSSEVNAFREYKDLNYDNPFGPYPLKIRNMGVMKKYIVEWYDPFTMNVVKVDTKSTTISGKLWLEYPELTTQKEGLQPIYWFKAYPKKVDSF